MMSLKPWPSWMHHALQGITYWIGHRRCFYRNYPLSEGALVAEVCNLIHSNLPDDLTLKCEVQYSDLLGDIPRPDELTERARADLVVFNKPTEEDDESVPMCIIEVKRAAAPNSQINADLRRLAAVLDLLPSVRMFLFVISEAQRPVHFVNAEGHSILGKRQIPHPKGYYRVRRTWKAAHAYTKRERAHYACLIEVFAPPAARSHI